MLEDIIHKELFFQAVANGDFHKLCIFSPLLLYLCTQSKTLKLIKNYAQIITVYKIKLNLPISFWNFLEFRFEAISMVATITAVTEKQFIFGLTRLTKLTILLNKNEGDLWNVTSRILIFTAFIMLLSQATHCSKVYKAIESCEDVTER